MRIGDRAPTLTNWSTARKLFTNRRHDIRHFLAYLRADPPHQSILFFYGDGGNGKSLLIDFLKTYCCKDLSSSALEHLFAGNSSDLVERLTKVEGGGGTLPTALLDFGARAHGDDRPAEPFSALLMLRRALAGYGLEFPRYDTASLVYLHKTKQLTEERLRALFPAEELDVLSSIASAITDVPGLSLGKAVYSALDKRLRKHLHLGIMRRKVGDEWWALLQSWDPDREILPALPELFADDINRAMALPGAPHKLVLFFDAHEALWGEQHGLGESLFFGRDDWLRMLLASLDFSLGIVAVVAGRDCPRWPDAPSYRIPREHIDAQLVGCLSNFDAALYLSRAGITDGQIQKCLIDYASVAEDQVHPLFLGFCGDVVLSARGQGQELTPGSFPGAPLLADKGRELVGRLMQWCDRNIAEAIYALSASRSFDQAIYELLGSRLGFETSSVGFELLTRFSFVSTIEGRQAPSYRFHDVLRRLIRQQAEEQVRRADAILEEHYRASADELARIQAIYHACMLDNERGITEWLAVFRQALETSRYAVCRELLNVRKEVPVASDLWRGRVGAAEAEYLASIARYDEARQQYLEAVERFDEALRRQAGSLEAYLDRGNALRRLGDLQSRLAQQANADASYAESVTSFNEVLRRMPDSVDAQVSKGIALRSIGQLRARFAQSEAATISYREAIAAFDVALLHAADSDAAHKHRQLAVTLLGELQTQLAHHEDAQLGYTQAIAELDKLLGASPDDLEALMNKGLALRGLGRVQSEQGQTEPAAETYAQAIATYDRVLTRAVDLTALNGKGVALKQLGSCQMELASFETAAMSFASAIAAFDQILRQAPDDIRACHNKGLAIRNLGFLKAKRGQYEAASAGFHQAIVFYDQVLQVAPDEIVAHENKGKALSDLGDLQAAAGQHETARASFGRAVDAFGEVLKRAPDDASAHQIMGSALRARGQVAADQGNFDAARADYGAAIASFNTALRLAPDDRYAQRARGLALQELGDLHVTQAKFEAAATSYAQATAAFEGVLRTAPDDAYSHTHRAYVLQRVGDMRVKEGQYAVAMASYTQAIAGYDDVLRLAPADAYALRQRGFVYQTLKELRKGRTPLEAAIELRTERLDAEILIRKQLVATQIYALGHPAGDISTPGQGTESDLLHFTIDHEDGERVMLPIFTRLDLASDAVLRNPDWQSLSLLEIGGGALLDNIEPDVYVVLNPWSRLEFVVPPSVDQAADPVD